MVNYGSRFRTPLPFWYLNKQIQKGFDSKQFDLVDVVRHCSKSRCQDLRDKIYALQGLLPENSSWRLPEVDYSKRTETVFYEATAILLLYRNPNSDRTAILDAVWHLACEMGFRALAEQRGIQLGLNLLKLRPLILQWADGFENLVKEIQSRLKEPSSYPQDSEESLRVGGSAAQGGFRRRIQ